jgi:type I restriction enzyme M protein
MPAKRKTSSPKDSSANLDCEVKLWLAADKLRNNRDALAYKHFVLGLIFLKCLFDSIDEHHAKLIAGERNFAGANLKYTDEYLPA